MSDQTFIKYVHTHDYIYSYKNYNHMITCSYACMVK